MPPGGQDNFEPNFLSRTPFANSNTRNDKDFVRKESKKKTLQRLTLDIEEERKSLDGVDHVVKPRREPSDQAPIERVKGTDERSMSSRRFIENEDDQEKIGDATPPFGSLINIQNTAGIVTFKTRNLQKEPDTSFQADISSPTPPASEPHLSTT
jgi:hypothetical protein